MRIRSLCSVAVFGGLAALSVADASAAISCQRNVSADVVAFDKPLMYNRLGAGNVNGMIYALRRDVINTSTLKPLTAGGAAIPGQLDLRPDKRPRPLVLRVRRGDCLTVNFQNLLTGAPNPLNVPLASPPTLAQTNFNIALDEQVASRTIGFHAAGMQLVDTIASDGSWVGRNASSLAAPGASAVYELFAEKEGVFIVTSGGATFGSDANQGHTSNGLFGQVIVEPTKAAIYRSQVFEEELRLATTARTTDGHPIVNYEAVYPNTEPWISEGKAGLPVLNMMNCDAAGANCAIVHSEINAVNAYGPTGRVSQASPNFPASTYPLESAGKRNPTVPNRLEPFRDFASVFHDETANTQAFPGFFVRDPVFRYVLEGVKDAFMINYGSGGIGSEIIANRLGVGPMHDCLDCAYEEFFLTSFTVADPAMTVDVPANVGLENLLPGQTPPAGTTGPKAHFAIGAEDPANIHHSYTGDFVKFRNTHIGKEQHVFHLHNHQWLYNPNDDNSNYLDAQGIGPGAGYTYEINFGGSGNRNKSAGDAIFHCHFYPHFAQGMWYHWRHHDTFEPGTILAATPNARDAQGFDSATGFHTAVWALGNTTPAAGARAYPDGEISTGTPIPALVPLPGKPMAPVPGRVTVVAKVGANGTVVGSNAKVIDRNINPGYPFWIAGVEDSIGQRPPTPPMDMANAADVARAQAADSNLFGDLKAAQADGWDGGLPRHTLQGFADAGVPRAQAALSVVSRLDFSKEILRAKPVYYPEEGTDVEQTAMAFHALRCHNSFKPDGTAASCTGGVAATFKGQTGQITQGTAVTTGGFITNGAKPAIGAVYHNPCIDDQGHLLAAGVVGNFFSGESATANPMNTHGSSIFNSDSPRIYKGSFLQFDAVLNKVGYHFPQQRIVALWQDVAPVIAKQKPPEPLVFRMNTFDCAVYHNSNLVPANYEIDDFQVRTPTDVIGQHIHLPKWDLTTTDGAANGWNYEDGTLSPDVVRERIAAINAFVANGGTAAKGTGAGALTVASTLTAKPHPFFAQVAAQLDGTAANLAGGAGTTFQRAWLGARTTIERWFTDPVVNTEGTDRGLGIIFTHDHYGPSTHQQIGLYSTLLTEPAGSRWVHNETAQQLGYDPITGAPARTFVDASGITKSDGGPTSWQAAILPLAANQGSNTVGAGALEPYREFYFEYADFQHAYEAGVYVGNAQNGLPLAGTGPEAGPVAFNAGNPQFNGATTNAFRFAINPPARQQVANLFPDLVVEVKGGVIPGCPTRPCPQAISVQDPGVLVVNYRNEPVGLRIYDPNKPAPDGKLGMQADGQRGDLAYALQSRTDRAIPQLNVQPVLGTSINGTLFPAPINAAGVTAGDPFTPMIRTFTGDLVRFKMQAGAHEEEHNASINGMKWLQAGSGHGRAPNSGWRNAQAGGISEQFTLSIPVTPGSRNAGSTDYAYSVDMGHDGWWSGMWGILRSYNVANQPRLFMLPTTISPVQIANAGDFRGNSLCPSAAPVRAYDITAVLANNVLPNALGVTVPANVNPTTNVGGPLNPAGGTLVYNNRAAVVGGGQIVNDVGVAVTLPRHQGPINDPTAILYVRTADIGANGKLLPNAPVEPAVIRAAAGECIQVTLRNLLPGTALAATTGRSAAPDLPTLSTVQGIVKRDRFDPEGATTFQTNLFRASNAVGITPQLVAFDVANDGGLAVGNNPPGPVTVSPGASKTFFWYAGDITATRSAGQFTRVATPVEFGGASLMPADRMKQGAKSLVGAISIVPQGASWPGSAANLFAANTNPGQIKDPGDVASLVDTQIDHQTAPAATPPTRKTRAETTVTSAVGLAGSGGTFRDFSLVLTKGLTHYYKDASPVEHLNGEAAGIPEDSQEASGMALNYGIEPAWFRFGLVPQAPFGGAGCAGGCFGAVANAEQLYSNSLGLATADPAGNVSFGAAVGDPVTPIFTAASGQPFRMHITNPYGTTRGTTFALHGHVWERDPYVCPGSSRNGLTGACTMTEVASRALGNNLQGFAQGGQESWTPGAHFDIVVPSAGGGNGVKGDYLIRDQAAWGNASGVWGIMRVQ